MKRVLYLVGLLFISMILSSFFIDDNTDCEIYFPVEVGTTFEITDYNKKGKVRNISKHEVLGKDSTGIKSKVSVYFGLEQKNPITEIDYLTKCDGDNFLFNAASTSLASLTRIALEGGIPMGIELVEIEGGFINIPSNPSIEQSLKTGHVYMDTKSKFKLVRALTLNKYVRNAHMMPMVSIMSFRKVVAITENITTPAGTFNCIKISQDVDVKTIQKIKTKVTTWYAKGVGMVRSESYNRRGKLMGYSELTKFTNP